MSSILQDLRYAARRLVRDRRFTLVNAVLLRSLPFAEPDRIMWLGTRDAQGGDFGVSEPDFEDWRRATRTFSGIASDVDSLPTTIARERRRWCC